MEGEGAAGRDDALEAALDAAERDEYRHRLTTCPVCGQSVDITTHLGRPAPEYMIDRNGDPERGVWFHAECAEIERRRRREASERLRAERAAADALPPGVRRRSGQGQRFFNPPNAPPRPPRPDD
jgi:hypothetical protein